MNSAIADICAAPLWILITYKPRQWGEMRPHLKGIARLVPASPMNNAPPAPIVSTVAAIHGAPALGVWTNNQRVAVPLPSAMVHVAHAAAHRLAITFLNSADRRIPLGCAYVGIAVFLPPKPVSRTHAPSAKLAGAAVD